MVIEHIEKLFNIPAQKIQFEGEILASLKLGHSRGQLLTTTSLNNHTMPTPSKFNNQANIELYFLLPEYWNFDEKDPLFHWAIATLVQIKKYLEKDHWAISGHTFALKNLPNGKFKDAGFDALMLIDPIAIKELQNPIESLEHPVHFKALCPIFKKEKDIKESKGLDKFLIRMRDKGMNEKIDEFRISLIKSSILFWK